MNDLTFFTNEQGQTLSDRFKKIIKNNTQFFDVLVGYFRASGFYEIYEALENVEKIRILVGINVDEETVLVNNVAKSSDGEKYYFSTKEIKTFTKKAIKEELENSEDTYEIDLGVKKFIEYLQNGKIEIRVYPYDKIHAKVYIMRKDLDKSEDFGKVITGSSNFSYSGLKGNLEFNVELKNSVDVKYALDKFESLWEVSEPLNEEYVSTLKNDTWIKEDITPYELYLKFLFEYFADEINEDKVEVNVSDLPAGFVNYKYQTDAVNQAKRMLERYNGVFLADVVGLGKTFITALLARELIGQKLVICPPVLKNYWEETLREFGVLAKVVSLGKLDEILDNYPSDYFRYVFIDEAHRFRNEGTEAYGKLHKICINKKVILISATPQNNSSMDLLNLISLFQYKNESNIIEDEPNLEKFFKRLSTREKNAIKLQKDNPTEANKNKVNEIIKANSSEIRENVLKKIMVRRLRNEIKKFYKNDIEKQGLVFPNLGDPEQIIYTFDEETNEIFEQFLKAIGDLNYSRYKTLTYLLNPNAEESTLMIGQVNMQGFMKALLLKRLESSFFAFKNTIRRFKESYEKFLNMYNQGTVYISKKYDVYELLANEDDEKLMELVADGEIEKYESVEFRENLKDDLEKDLNVLNEMYQSIERLGNKDCKLEYFLEDLRKNKILKDSKIIIFTESKETAEYLTRNIEKNLNKEVICYTGSSNTSKKDVIIANFDPNFKGKKEDRYNILNKIQAFHNTLGEEFKYLSDDEEIDSYGLYDKLMASLENEEETMGESELEYLSLIRNIRDEDEELYLKIKNLPKKSKSSREYRETFIEPSTISFLKRGENKRIYITNRNLEVKELAFFDAVKYFKCKVDEPRQEIDNEFYQLLAINKATFAQTSETKKTEEIKKAGKSREIQKIIDGLRNYKKFNESEEKKLEKIIEIFEVGKLSKNYVKNILQECKKVFETANPHRILEVFYETIPEEYKGVTQKRVDKRGHKIEVLLSEYLI
ncbi:phospholipase D-like domain-containing protein [uncultured Fusobacterium sp.]|uniref:phospholipase D-like domain-containing protein n=1 Tax=uncultured Fusobacterium sp. TaxID=159267 RepID=UPI0025E8EA56|nr:phospholipase D-like domain-containing protein [uncultured Fusobacterium sp.]